MLYATDVIETDMPCTTPTEAGVDPARTVAGLPASTVHPGHAGIARRLKKWLSFRQRLVQTVAYLEDVQAYACRHHYLCETPEERAFWTRRIAWGHRSVNRLSRLMDGQRAFDGRLPVRRLEARAFRSSEQQFVRSEHSPGLRWYRRFWQPCRSYRAFRL